MAAYKTTQPGNRKWLLALKTLSKIKYHLLYGTFSQQSLKQLMRPLIDGVGVMINNNNILEFTKARQKNQPGRLLVPERLTELRIANRLTQTELAKDIGVSRQAVSSYERGEKSPDPAVMMKIAKVLEQPISYFIKGKIQTFGRHSANFFRKTGTDTKRRNSACEVFAKWLGQISYAFDHIANFPQVDIPEFVPVKDDYTNDEIEYIANKVRKHFGLGLGPISNVLRLIEAKGVIVSRYDIPNEKIDAFSFWCGKRPFVFLASGKRSGARVRFDCAHELGHLVLHKWIGREEIENRKRLKMLEAQANQFAGAFLLPQKSFTNEIYSPRAESFIDLKSRWKVPIQAMVYRCKDLAIFDDQQVTNLCKQISYKKWRTTEPLDSGVNALRIEEPLLLKRVAELVFASGKYEADEFKSDIALSDEILSQFIGLNFINRGEKIKIFTPTLR